MSDATITAIYDNHESAKAAVEALRDEVEIPEAMISVHTGLTDPATTIVTVRSSAGHSEHEVVEVLERHHPVEFGKRKPGERLEPR